MASHHLLFDFLTDHYFLHLYYGIQVGARWSEKSPERKTANLRSGQFFCLFEDLNHSFQIFNILLIFGFSLNLFWKLGNVQRGLGPLIDNTIGASRGVQVLGATFPFSYNWFYNIFWLKQSANNNVIEESNPWRRSVSVPPKSPEMGEPTSGFIKIIIGL